MSEHRCMICSATDTQAPLVIERASRLCLCSGCVPAINATFAKRAAVGPFGFIEKREVVALLAGPTGRA